MASMIKHVHEFAIDVDLHLLGGGIASADRLRAFIAANSVDRPFGNATLSGQSIHDLQSFRLSGGGAQRPFAPSARIFVEPGFHGCQQREKVTSRDVIIFVQMRAVRWAIRPSKLGKDCQA